MGQCIAGRPSLSLPPKPAHGHPTVKWFLLSPARRISHFFTNTQNTTYTTERVEEKRTNKYGLGLAPSAKRRSLWHFSVAFCASVNYREHVFERNSSKATRNSDSSSHVGQPSLWLHRSLPSPSSDRRLLPTSIDCSFLLTALSCWLLSSLLFSDFFCSLWDLASSRLLPVP